MTMPKSISLMMALWLPLVSMAHAGNNTPHAQRPSVKTWTIDTGTGCVFRITDKFRGHAVSGVPGKLPGYAFYWTDQPPIKTMIGDFRLPFECIDVTPQTMHEVIEQEYGGHYDTQKKKWAPYFVSEEDRKLGEDVTRLYPIKAANADGFAITEDQINGDYAQRTRFLSYCLLHGKKALCGQTQIMILSDPKGSLLPSAMKILRSIEFIDPPSAKPVTTPSPASSAP